MSDSSAPIVAPEAIIDQQAANGDAVAQVYAKVLHPIRPRVLRSVAETMGKPGARLAQLASEGRVHGLEVLARVNWEADADLLNEIIGAVSRLHQIEQLLGSVAVPDDE